MRIIYLHQHFSTPKGSAGNRSYQMARALVSEGHQVTMLCGSYSGGTTGLTGNFQRGIRRGIVDGIDVIECNLPYSNATGFLRRSLLFLRFMLRTIGFVLTERYDILFATTTPLTVGVPGIIGRWLRGKPFVFEVRDLWPELPKAMGAIRNPAVLRALAILEKASYRSADRLIGLSPGIAEGIARVGVDKERIAMIPNGCDLEIFATDAPERPEGIAASHLLAIYAGTHGMANALDSALDAAAVLRRRGRDDIRILLVGQGGQKDALVERARREGLDNVLFHAPVPKEKLASFMAGADVGLQLLANVPAFYYGTSPNKFFDYLSAGLPVLCNYPGWVADMIERDHIGFAVAPDDPEAFADALERAAAAKAELPAMGKRAHSLGQREFDRPLLARQWVDWVTGTVR
ncbi:MULTISPECIES: glycosyltransferase family 4 protein [unclassified Sphingopyxis]|uniref:glycosyltransferase family 4 protein n=1 Tax=unclassified Sphingopyxis TaxID=2614943 RepID=UPI000730B3A9|nr:MULTISPECIES: glycosyltransferase family 4 protein [unclassified Sphingopyxis]KTE26276.1 glycosyltransferase WbuB [Sphingopyxis sp. H057]KTE52679.1 glycosyltransferase WbuB [Sphingopyxis sp. H073]KTE54870.1 glycosyltransferase WbuB [Sphingopyxis sp. H071]KTE62329.1 glycosyltransferase WbuB [Sphingopyxis sp. H107]KTE65875.1 glycosyltransferase WbuB [Sphingopyxis sp. H100]